MEEREVASDGVATETLPATQQQPQQAATAVLPFEPENATQMWRMAQWIAKSALIPSALRGKEADIWLVISTGRELGLTPMQALRSLHVVDGKPGMSADLIAARINKSGLSKYLRLVESSETVATFETWRADHPEAVRMSFTIEDARRAGLAEKDNYKKHPKSMLRARCLSAIGHAVYPELFFGVYELDEVQEIKETEARVIEQAPASPAPRTLDDLTAKLREPKEPKWPAPPPALSAASATAASGPLVVTQETPSTARISHETAAALEEQPAEPAPAPAPKRTPKPKDAAPTVAPGSPESIDLQLAAHAQKLGPERFSLFVRKHGGDPIERGYGLGLDAKRELLNELVGVPK